MTDKLLDAALQYAAIGWPVFPCGADKTPLIEGGNGFKDATTDPAIIRAWWARYPGANIGFYPHGAGIAVVDVDVKNNAGGPEQLEALESVHGRLPVTAQQDSPSGGYHLLFRTGKALPNNKLAPGIDVRCANGYILLAPSKADGKEYAWNDGFDPFEAVMDLELAELPQWVIDVQQEGVQRATKAPAKAGGLTYVEPDEAAQASIAERLAAFLMRSPMAARRYGGSTNGLTDTSGSAMDMSMCVLLKIGGFDYSEMRFILQDWPHGSIDPQRSEGDRYWERLWHNSRTPETVTESDLSSPDLWPDPVDLFADDPVPQFPLDVLPEVIRNYSLALSEQSGFDPGGYAFCALVVASGLINHSLKLQVTTSWKSAAVLWGGLSTASGSGKDPVMIPMVAPVEAINSRLMADSMQDIKRWQEASKKATKDGETPPPRPKFKQRVIKDTTVEAAAQLLTNNDGLLLLMSEITEFIGRMDAYSGGGKGASKDRGAWLRARDGGSHVINRASRDIPDVVQNFSIAMLAGVQPEKLAELMGKRGGGSSDGLFQRFLMYMVQRTKEADLMAGIPDGLPEQYADLFDVIQEWNVQGYSMFPPRLEQDAVRVFNEYLNTIRSIAQNTPAGRFTEHLNKYPGFTLNLTLTLHVLECAAKAVKAKQAHLATELTDGGFHFQLPENSLNNTVSTETLHRALTIMRVLYRHSEAAYAYMDEARPEVRNLAMAAGDAALTKGWKVANMGDLSRHATGWRGADQTFKQEALNLLIEMGWMLDVTPPVEAGRRGRPSEGRFAFNPKAHERFQHRAAHVVEQRKQRYEAIQKAAMARTA